MDIVVTIPKSEYKNDDKELLDMKELDLEEFWTFKRLPTKLEIGDRIYFVKYNRIDHSMKVTEICKDSKEECYTTDREWEGNIVYMEDYKKENLPISIKGFMGFRYKWW